VSTIDLTLESPHSDDTTRHF